MDGFNKRNESYRFHRRVANWERWVARFTLHLEYLRELVPRVYGFWSRVRRRCALGGHLFKYTLVRLIYAYANIVRIIINIWKSAWSHRWDHESSYTSTFVSIVDIVRISVRDPRVALHQNTSISDQRIACYTRVRVNRGSSNRLLCSFRSVVVSRVPAKRPIVSISD